MTDVLAEFRRWVFNEVGVTEEGAWTQEFDRLLRAALVRTPETLPEGLRAPYGGHPEFGPRVMANQAQPSIAGWESLAKDALLAFDQARAALAASPAPDPGAGLREALVAVGPGTIADLAWSHAKHEWRTDLGYWSAMEDAAGRIIEDDQPMASLAAAILRVAPSAEPPETET